MALDTAALAFSSPTNALAFEFEGTIVKAPVKVVFKFVVGVVSYVLSVVVFVGAVSSVIVVVTTSASMPSLAERAVVVVVSIVLVSVVLGSVMLVSVVLVSVVLVSVVLVSVVVVVVVVVAVFVEVVVVVVVTVEVLVVVVLVVVIQIGSVPSKLPSSRQVYVSPGPRLEVPLTQCTRQVPPVTMSMHSLVLKYGLSGKVLTSHPVASQEGASPLNSAVEVLLL